MAALWTDARTETRQYSYNYELNRFEFEGEPPGDVILPNETFLLLEEEVTGNVYWVLRSGQILAVTAPDGSFLGVFPPSHPMVPIDVEIPEIPLLVDVDPETGLVSNPRVVTGPFPYELLYVPEPATTGLLFLAGLALVVHRRCRSTG